MNLNSNNKLGYLIYRNKFYIFQPQMNHIDIPMIYRTKKYFSKRGKINLNQLTKKNLKNKTFSSKINKSYLKNSPKIEYL